MKFLRFVGKICGAACIYVWRYICMAIYMYGDDIYIYSQVDIYIYIYTCMHACMSVK